MVYGSNVLSLQLDYSYIYIGAQTAAGKVTTIYGQCSYLQTTLSHYKLVINPVTRNIRLFINNSITPSIDVTPATLAIPSDFNVEFFYGNYRGGPAYWDNIYIIQKKKQSFYLNNTTHFIQ